MERVKRLVGNEIELGMMIPTIEYRASNIPMTKVKEICPRGIIKLLFIFPYIMINVYYSC